MATEAGKAVRLARDGGSVELLYLMITDEGGRSFPEAHGIAVEAMEWPGIHAGPASVARRLRETCRLIASDYQADCL